MNHYSRQCFFNYFLLLGVKCFSIVILLVSSIVLSGCINWATQNANGSHVQHYLGYTIVVLPKTLTSDKVPFEVKEVSNIGISVGTMGITLGYAAHKKILLPHENSFYIEVATEEQFQQLKQFLQKQRELKLWIQKQAEND